MQPVTCPACGGENTGDAVFCMHCNKALGPFRYVREEVDAMTSRYERVAERVTAFVGQPHFFAIHLVWFGIWIAVNAGLLMGGSSVRCLPV